MNPGEVVGAIKVDRKPRTSKTLAQRIADKARQVEKAIKQLERRESEYKALLEQAKRQRADLDGVLARP